MIQDLYSVIIDKDSRKWKYINITAAKPVNVDFYKCIDTAFKAFNICDVITFI